jgi:hypothetical protein
MSSEQDKKDIIQLLDSDTFDQESLLIKSFIETCAKAVVFDYIQICKDVEVLGNKKE